MDCRIEDRLSISSLSSFFLHAFAVIFRTNVFPLNEENMLPYDHFNAEDIIELKGVCWLPFTRARPRPRVVSCRTWPRK